MIKLKDIVKDILTEGKKRRYRRCMKACAGVYRWSDCENKSGAPFCGGIMAGGSGGLYGSGTAAAQQATTKRPSHSQFGQRQPRTTRLQRKSISRNRYRR